MGREGPRDRTRSWSEGLDGCFFALSALIGVWFAFVLLRDGVRPGWPTLLLVVFWLFFSYLVLPRLHRILSAVYLPAYFVGRTRTIDGRLGDPVNVACLGEEAQVHRAMTEAGWTRADDLDLRSAVGMVRSVLRGRSYAGAPVSPLRLFDRIQDFAYEQEVAGSPTRRHHIRFWRCPDDWLLPGGFRVDWLAAATFDRGVGLSWFTLQITHRIEEDIDAERDFVVASVQGAVPSAELSVIKSFSSGYHHRNGGGDRIRTDGDLPILDVRCVPVRGSSPAREDEAPRARPSAVPAPVLVGCGVAVARAATYGVAAVDHLTSGSGKVPVPVSAPVVVFVAFALVELSLALLVLAGLNWARLLLVAGCSVVGLAAMAVSIFGHERPVGLAQLLAVGGSILVLLALSSDEARSYATSRATRRATRAAARRRAHESGADPAPRPREGTRR